MTPQPISRRAFLKTAGLVAGGGALACCGLTVAATQLQPAAPTQAVDTPTTHYGKDHPMQTPILVAYATRTGSTVGVAQAIGETLAARGYPVDVRPMKEDPDPAGYAAVVLGSAVNGAKWLPEAVQYTADHAAALRQAAVALFCVHIMNAGDDERSRQKRLAYLDEARRNVSTPVDEGFFLGLGIDPADNNALVRWAYKLFGGAGVGDCRDWTRIRAWGQAVFA